MKIYEVNDRIAGIVPLALPAEQEALNNDVRVNGLLTPIVLWKGMIVDGRCRQLACIEASVEIRAEELGWDKTEEEVLRIVKSLNTRRNLTMTQKCMSAIKYYYNNLCKMTLEDVAKEWGVSRQTMLNVNYLYKYHTSVIEPLFNGNSIWIEDAKGNPVKSNKVNSICAYVKRSKEVDTLRVTNSEEHEWNPNSAIHTQAGKDWYYETINDTGLTNRIPYLLAELANLKYTIIT